MPQYTSTIEPTVDTAVWETHRVNGQWKIFCKPCNDNLLMPGGRNPYTEAQHERGSQHQAKLQRFNSEPRHELNRIFDLDTPFTPAVPIRDKFDYAATTLIQSFVPSIQPRESLPDFSVYNNPDNEDPMPTSFWDMNALGDDDHFQRAADEGCVISDLLARVAGAMANGPEEEMEFNPDVINSDDEGGEADRLEGETEDEEQNGEPVFLGQASKQRRMEVNQLHEWFPWDSWLDVPSTKTMKDLNANLQKLFGIQTYHYKGAFGHIYYVNSFADIISQEMSNPKIRPNLSFYPEAAGSYLGDARQAERWLKEMDDDELTPMVRLGTGNAAQDFYIFEPTLLRDGSVWMP
ncbi:hypothetical protein PM082_002300 [Marasmius tenuissimus]|nr:hypothetical protein PM082_002300 [Marasmius tenuissimus]